MNGWDMLTIKYSFPKVHKPFMIYLSPNCVDAFLALRDQDIHSLNIFHGASTNNQYFYLKFTQCKTPVKTVGINSNF